MPLPNSEGVRMQNCRRGLRLRVADVLEVVAGLLFIVILGLAIGQVVTRYLLNNPSSWTEVVARLLLVWATFIAVGAAAAKEQLLAVDVLLERLPPAAQRVTKAMINLLMAVVGVVLLVFGWKLYQFTGGDVSTSLGYPRSLFYLPVPLGGFFLSAFSLANVVRHGRNVGGPAAFGSEGEHSLPDR